MVNLNEIPPREEIEALAGHRFPGGDYTIRHWENFLLTECTGAELLPGGMAHPIALFHLPISGAGISIAGMFALGQAESDLSIMIESYENKLADGVRRMVLAVSKAGNQASVLRRP